MGAVMGCNEMVFDHENADSNMGIAMTYGSELAGNFGMKECGADVVRDGKCEAHKVERRKSLFSDRRVRGSSDSAPSCGNGLCKVEFGQTKHHRWCEEHGPGWA